MAYRFEAVHSEDSEKGKPSAYEVKGSPGGTIPEKRTASEGGETVKRDPANPSGSNMSPAQ